MENSYQIKVWTPKYLIEVLNGTFDTDLSSWFSNNFFWDSGKARKNIKNYTGFIKQQLNIINGERYKIKFTLDVNDVSYYKINLGGNETPEQYTGSGTYELELIAGTTNGFLTITFGEMLSGTIDDITVTLMVQDSIDLFDNITIPLTYQINTSSDLGKRSGNYSYDIRIPGTRNNLNIFQHIQDVNENNNILLDTNYNCEVFDNDIKILEGVLQISEIINNDDNINFNCTITDGIIILSDILGDKLMYGNLDNTLDLNLSEYDHPLLYTYITQSWNNLTAGNAPYYYPLIDRGYGQPYMLVGECKPAISLPLIIEKLFIQNGYEVDVDFNIPTTSGSLYYYREIPVLIDAENLSANATIVEMNGLNSVTYVQWVPGPVQQYGYDYHEIKFNNTIQDQLNQYNVLNYIWTCDTTGNYNININGLFEIGWDNNNSDKIYLAGNGNILNGMPKKLVNSSGILSPYFVYSFALYKNGNLIQIIHRTNDDPDVNTTNTLLSQMTFEGEYNAPNPVDGNSFVYSIPANTTYSVQYTDNVTFQPVDMLDGDTLQFVMWVDNRYTKANTGFVPSSYHFNGIDMPHITYVKDLDGIRLNVNRTVTNISENDIVKLNKYFGKDIKQIDFLTSVLKYFNLSCNADLLNKKKYIIKPMNLFYTNANVLDWTDKLDHDSDINITKPTENIGVSIRLINDEDRLNKKYATINNKVYGEYRNTEEAKGNINEITIDVFSPTPMYRLADTTDIYCPHMFKINDDLTESVINKDITLRPRILLANMIQSQVGQTWSLRPSHNLNVKYYEGTVYPYIGHLDNPYTEVLDLNFDKCDMYWNITNDGTITQSNTFNLFYRNYLSNYFGEHSKKLTGKFWLNTSDISSLDFSKLIYINDAYYLLESINNYVSGQLTECALIKYIPEYLEILPSIGIDPAPIQIIIYNPPNSDISNNDIIMNTNMLNNDINQLYGAYDGVIIGQQNILKGTNEVVLINMNKKIYSNVSNETHIGNKVYGKTSLIEEPDTIDAGLNTVLNPFSCIVTNIIDCGNNSTRKIGSFSILTNIDGTN